jgi:hypothetical protein
LVFRARCIEHGPPLVTHPVQRNVEHGGAERAITRCGIKTASLPCRLAGLIVLRQGWTVRRDFDEKESEFIGRPARNRDYC